MIYFLYLALVPLIQEGSLSSTSDYDTGCKCGMGTGRGAQAQEPSDPINFVNMQSLLMQRSRIVNGFEPQRRPWMVLIELHRNIPKKGVKQNDNPTCGGVLVNKVRELRG